ncbi:MULTISPECIES: COG4223 family protein [Hyphomonas]|uniref:Uncharacterized protein n=1 Tax=Hyphomonas adhaerens TaxID=81029 RepID=A0A3B9H0N2_9PROT|nr:MULTISPECIES: mitofilin family membrane protein [Hyphomonas]MBB39653.1 hypothetical protein [Hyphomonas sp.]HAE28251.1 hypothetical protein [Hyphomonas adhaerens]|tara:strand:- start:1919 stop:3082 length:1164 start_codon:yes stop_codon:yes gene_type:complete
MTDDSIPESSVDPGEPIDADFELAPDEGKAPKAGGGPGWLGAGVMSVMAAGLGGLIGIGAHMVLPPSSGLGNADEEVAALNDRIGKLEQAAPDDRAALKAGIDALANRIDNLPAGNAAPVDLTGIIARLDALESVEPGDTVAPEDLARALGALSDRLDALEARPLPVDLSTRVAALERDVETLRDSTLEQTKQGRSLADMLARVQTEQSDARAEAASASSVAEAALALSAIEAASRRGEPFESDYRALRAALPTSDDVRVLGPLATEGVPTRAELTETFAAAADAARRTVPTEDSGRWGWINKFFGGAVTVRKADGSDADPFALLSRAAEALEKGDLEGAVSYTTRLDGPTGTAMSGWTEDAKRRITLETSLEAVRLALADGGAKTP